MFFSACITSRLRGRGYLWCHKQSGSQSNPVFIKYQFVGSILGGNCYYKGLLKDITVFGKIYLSNIEFHIHAKMYFDCFVF